MWIGTGIFFLALGAILAFAVQDAWDVIDLTMIGYIFMGAGALAIVLSLLLRRRPTPAPQDYPERRDPGYPPQP